MPSRNSSLKLSSDEKLRLVKLYKNQELLYNRKHIMYNDKKARKRALKSIRNSMGLLNTKVKKIKKKLRKLRKAFARERKKIIEEQKSGRVYVPNLRWYTEMASFMTIEQAMDTNDVSEEEDCQPGTSFAASTQSQVSSSTGVTTDQPGPSNRRISQSSQILFQNGFSEDDGNSQPSTSFAASTQSQGSSNIGVTTDQPGPSNGRTSQSSQILFQNGFSEDSGDSQPSTSFAANTQSQGSSSIGATIDQPGPSNGRSQNGDSEDDENSQTSDDHRLIMIRGLIRDILYSDVETRILVEIMTGALVPLQPLDPEESSSEDDNIPEDQTLIRKGWRRG